MTILLVACNATATPVVLPTSAVQPTAIPPTSTSVSPVTQPTVAPQERATLPPTWTPEGGSTTTPNPLPQIEMIRATPAVCTAFLIDRARTPEQVLAGTAPTIYWTRIETAARYRVRLFDAELNDLLVEYTQEGQFTFDAALFQQDRKYGWEVIAENASFQQMCFAIGGELFANLR